MRIHPAVINFCISPIFFTTGMWDLFTFLRKGYLSDDEIAIIKWELSCVYYISNGYTFNCHHTIEIRSHTTQEVLHFYNIPHVSS